jgi:hypothetical protein
MVDYVSTIVGSESYRSNDNFVSDLIGIYDGKRQISRFYDYLGGTKIILQSKGLFRFSNKLLEKIKGFKDDPIKALEFLNPEKCLTGSECLTIQSHMKRKQHEAMKSFRSELNIIIPKYEYIKIKL